MTYGYARCSTDESRQNISRQISMLKEMGATDDTIYKEYDTGTKFERVEFNKLLNIISQGDVIVSTEVSRITRSSKDLCSVIDIAKDKKVKLIIGSFVVDFTLDNIDPMTEGILKLMGVFAELERNIISERVRSGMENAKRRGKHIGRNHTCIEDIPPSFIRCYDRYIQGDMSISELSKLSSSSRTTVYKYIKIIEKDDSKPKGLLKGKDLI